MSCCDEFLGLPSELGISSNFRSEQLAGGEVAVIVLFFDGCGMCAFAGPRRAE